MQLLLMAGTVSYTTCAGVCSPITPRGDVKRGAWSVKLPLHFPPLVLQALPQIFISRLGVRSAPVQTFFRSILPIPLSGTSPSPELRAAASCRTWILTHDVIAPAVVALMVRSNGRDSVPLQLLWPSSTWSPSGAPSQKRASGCLIPGETPSASPRQQETR